MSVLMAMAVLSRVTSTSASWSGLHAAARTPASTTPSGCIFDRIHKRMFRDQMARNESSVMTYKDTHCQVTNG